MPMEAQTRLLRVLQEGEYTTIGGRTPIKTDVRIIAATHRELKTQIQQGLFREDLFYRLNVVPLRLPPLRERLEDVGDLVRHFLRQAAKAGLGQKTIESAAIERVKRYHWPGNVRELENMVRRLAALHPEDTLTAEIIDAELAEAAPPPPAETGKTPRELSEMVERYLAGHFASYGRELPPAGLYDRILQHVERPLLMAALAATRGNQIRAAALLGPQPQHPAQEDPRPRHPGLPHPRRVTAGGAPLSPLFAERAPGWVVAAGTWTLGSRLHCSGS